MNTGNAPSGHTGLFQAQMSASAVAHSSAPRAVIQPNVSQSALNMSPAHSAAHHPLTLSYSAPFAAPPPFEGIVDFTSSHAPTSGPAYPTHGGQYQHAQAPMSLAARSESVDWKQSPFFTYRPNEVKHRKRTTRQQLKVLEETFHKTQKPDGNVRKALALQLNMTPRNVQVWFQNRRAKDKNLAKRTTRSVEDGTELDSHATLESTSPTTPIPKAEASGAFSERSFEQCIDFVSSPNDYRHEFAFAPSSTASSSPATAQPDLNGSTSPVEETFNRKFDIPSPPSISSVLSQPQAASGSSAVSPAGFSVEGIASQPIALPRNIFAPRKSLPHIRAPAYGQDLQHQRSTSTPSFISNVDTTSDLSLTTCASINGVLSMYPQNNNGQPAYPYHDRVRRMASGPLPTANYSFGMSSAQQPARETEHEFDPSSYGHYTQFNTVSGSNTPTSVSGFSQYQSVADSFEEDHAQVPYGWYPGRRGSSSQHVPSREFSPVSNGYSSGSPRPGTAEPETETHDGAIYMSGRNEWSTFTEEYKPNVNASPENKQPIGYQEIFGYNGLVDQTVMPISNEGYLAMTQTVTNASAYQPLMNSHSFVPQMASYPSDNQTPMVGFNSAAPVGYNYA